MWFTVWFALSPKIIYRCKKKRKIVSRKLENLLPALSLEIGRWKKLGSVEQSAGRKTKARRESLHQKTKSEGKFLLSYYKCAVHAGWHNLWLAYVCLHFYDILNKSDVNQVTISSPLTKIIFLWRILNHIKLIKNQKYRATCTISI